MKNSQMRLILLAALVGSVFAADGSLECYDGWNNGEQVQVACKCDVDEMAQFIQHVGNVCFGDGTIPQEFDPYFDFGDGCSGYGNNNGNYDACEEEQQMQNFWCGCLSTYMKKYGKFSDSCWIPDISEAMREMAGSTMESAWDEGACEWWEYSVERVLPNDISISLGANSETCVTPTPAATPAPEGDAADGRRRLQADCNNGDTTQTTLGSISLGATQDSRTGAIVAEDFQIDLDYNNIKAAYKEATGNQLMCGIKWENGYMEYEDWNDGEMLAWEIRRGWVFDDNDSSKGQATRYGAACAQEYTGDVLVTYAYATEVNDYGYIEEEDGERSVFWGDLTETYGPLYVGYDGTSIQYPRGCNNYNGNNNNDGNNNNYNNNNQNGQCEGQSEEGVREGANLAQALSYLLYNPNDVDMYSIVISCGGENDRQESNENDYNNNNYQNGSEECEYEEKEMCEGTVSQWAKPIVCSNFFVASDQIVETPAPEGGGNTGGSNVCKGVAEENNSSCESLSSEDDCGSDERCEWVSAGGWNDGGSNNGGGDNNGGSNGGGAGMELGDGMVAVSETENTIKTVSIIVLAAGCVALCFLWSCSKKSSYASVEEGGAARDTTPLRDDQL